MKILTVNVIEYENGTITNITSFSDDIEGNAEAEALFTEIAKNNGFADVYIEEALDDGFIEEGKFQLFITHGM